MSETTRLGVSITATDTNASASIKALQSTISALQDQIGQITRQASQWGGEMSAAAQRSVTALQGEISAIQAEIAARTQQVASVKAVTAAIKEQGEVAAVVHRSLSQGIDAAFGIGADRSIASATLLSEAMARAANQAELMGAKAAAASAVVVEGAAASTAAIVKQADAERAAALAASEAAEANARAAVASFRGRGPSNVAIGAEVVAAAEGANIAASAVGRIGTAANTTTRELRHVVAGFDTLSRGQRGAFFSVLGAAARDAGLGTTALATSVGGLVAVLGTEAILHHAEALGKWATDTRAAASAAGMSISNYSQLQGALVLTGQKADEADATLRRLAVNLSTALGNAASLPAQAFHNLGISQEQLVATGGDLGKLLPLLADAFTRTADGANKSANFAEIAGRGYQNLFKLLQNGSVSLDEFKAKAQELGITLDDDTAASLEKAGRSTEELSLKIHGEGIKAFEAWGATISSFSDLLGVADLGLLRIIRDIGDLPKNIGTVTDAINRAMGGNAASIAAAGNQPTADDAIASWQRRGTTRPNVVTPGASGGTSTAPGFESVPVMPVAPLVRGGASGEETALGQMRRDMAQAEEQASRAGGTAQSARVREAQAEIGVMQQTLQTAKLSAKEREQVETELAQKQTALRNEQLSAGVSAEKQATRDRVQAIKDGAKEEEDAARSVRLDTTLQSMAKGQFVYQGQAKAQGPSADISRSQQFVAEAEQIRSMASEEIAALTHVRDTAVAGSQEQRAAIQEIANVTLSSKQQEVALYEKAGAAAVSAANKINAAFLGFFDSVGNQFESLSSNIIKDLIAPQQDLIKAGLTTIKFNEMGLELRKAFTSAIVGVASDFGKSMETAIGHVIANALSSGAANSIGELLSQTLSKAVSSIFGNAAGSALGNVAGSAAGQAAGSTATVAAIGTAATTQVGAITTLGATLTGALATATASIVGAITGTSAVTDSLLTAEVAKPSFAGFTFAQGGIVPSAAGGMVGGTGATLAILHAREMVLPAPISQGLQAMIARGGNTSIGGNTANLSYSPTINAGRGRGGTGMTRGEFAQMMALHGGSMLGEARNMVRNGFRG